MKKINTIKRENVVKAIYKIVSKDKDIVNGLCVKNGLLIATDTYRLAQIRFTTNIEEGVYNLKDFNKIEVDYYPKYEQLINESYSHIEYISLTELYDQILFSAKTKKGEALVIQYKDKKYNKKYFIELLDILNELLVKSVEVSITNKGMLKIQSEQSNDNILLLMATTE